MIEFPLLASLLEGYDTSKKNREHYDDFAEWKKAAIQAGCAIVNVDNRHRKAEGHDGLTGEFDVLGEEGWLVDKWSKASVKESVGVPNPTPATKRNKKMADAVVAGYRKHIKTSGFNQSYAKKHRKEMNESKNELVCAIRDNWILWPVSKIVKELKLAMKSGKWASLKSLTDDELEDRVDSAKDDARNQYEGLNEGMYVVKSKDGVEKRFKDADSIDAKAWKEKTAKKASVKLAAYSDAYWKKKELDADGANSSDFTTPWKKIGEQGDDTDQIEKLVKDQHGGGKTDWTFGKSDEMKRDGTSCATRIVRIMFEYGPDDDMGVDEPTSDTQSIVVARNPKKPNQLDFIKYA